jgi:hypothetical protein
MDLPPGHLEEGQPLLTSRVVPLVVSLALAFGVFAAVASAAPAAKKPPKKCHPSYKGACLDPFASDYDCIGGSGNGPKYTGIVRVVGPDVFRLDADGDGWGCE